MMQVFVGRLIQTSLRGIVRKALALKRRGAVANDALVLALSELSGECLRLEWCARNIHPWDRDLCLQRQAELFCQQALHDTESAILRLFQMLPDINQIDFRVIEPQVSNRVILAGNVERAEVISASRLSSIRMRLPMMGVRFTMAGGQLEPLAA